MASVNVSLQPAGTSSPINPRFDHSLTFVDSAGGRKIFAIGGHGGVEEGAEIQVLSSDLSEWTNFQPSFLEGLDSTALKRGSHAAAVVGSSIFIVCGFGGDKSLGDVLELDTDDGTLSVPVLSGEAPSARSSHTATAIGTRIYVIGGHGEDTSLIDVHILDTRTKSWISPTVLGDPPSLRCAHSAEALGTDRIVVFGGYGDKPMNDVWFLEVDTAYVKEQREDLGSEVVAWSRASNAPPLVPVVVCGPSGVGKGTLIGKLMKEFPDCCGFSVSHTTRKPREGEINGVHYHFTTRDWMEPEVNGGRFLESADVHGNMYGTSIAAVQQVTDSGKMCVLDIDVQGAQQVKNSGLPATFVFISPPSYEELEKRLRGRGTETEAQIEKRLKNARAELERGKDTSLFNHTLVNDDLEACYVKLKDLLGLNSEQSSEIEGSPAPRSGHAAAMLNTKLVVHGGTVIKGSVTGDIHVLETAGISGGAPGPTSGLKWLPVEIGPLSLWGNLVSLLGYDPSALSPIARYNHKAVRLNNSDLLIVGGYDGPNEKPLADSAVLSIS